MNKVSVVFPHQLFELHPAIEAVPNVVLVESDLIFNHYHFHVAKLVLHRLSMVRYAEMLMQKGINVRYINAQSPLCNTEKLIAELSAQYQEIHLVEPEDDWLSRHIKGGLKGSSTDLKVYANPNFLTPIDIGYQFFDQKKRYFQTDFYAFQRKRLNLLLDENQKPLGGKLTYDSDNRKSYPKNHTFPKISLAPITNDFELAKSHISEHFPHSFGTLSHFEDHQYFYPSTTAEAKIALDEFLAQRFNLFGDYEDSFGKNPSEHFLYHAVLTPAMNIGLLNPDYVIEHTLEFAETHQIPLNSTEGFIRQITGWREFMRLVYHREGRKQRCSNFWNFNRKIPASFYDGTTGIEPVDIVIKKVLQTGYAHHIERLMVLGNFFLLCEFHPTEVYRWFMELFIDAYDWVMVPNIYGMSQFADGGIITTKPYLSGSNYITKMSDFQKKKEPWQEIWDGLYWRFINEHRQFFQQNPRLGMMVMTYDKMSEEKKAAHMNNANSFLNSLDLANAER